jgi:hypothetical protein
MVRSSSQSVMSSAKVRVAESPVGADPVDPIEVGQHDDVEQLGAGSGTEGILALAAVVDSSSSAITLRRHKTRGRTDGARAGDGGGA